MKDGIFNGKSMYKCMNIYIYINDGCIIDIHHINNNVSMIHQLMMTHQMRKGQEFFGDLQ